jgi:hypothetical protein
LQIQPISLSRKKNPVAKIKKEKKRQDIVIIVTITCKDVRLYTYVQYTVYKNIQHILRYISCTIQYVYHTHTQIQYMLEKN